MEGALKLLQKELFVCSLAAPFELFSGCKKLLEQNNRKLKWSFLGTSKVLERCSKGAPNLLQWSSIAAPFVLLTCSPIAPLDLLSCFEKSTNSNRKLFQSSFGAA